MNSEIKTRSDAEKVLRDLWKDRLEADFGHLVIDFIAKNSNAKHLTFLDFFEIANRHSFQNSEVVANVVNYLTGAQLHLLNTEFEYIDGDQIELLELDQVRAAKYERINPVTGELDLEVNKKIFVYFSPSQFAKDVLVKQ